MTLNELVKLTTLRTTGSRSLEFEPKRQKTYLRACTPSLDLDQPAHLQSHHNLHWAHIG